ncbi:MAG: DegT/DnrJ/EryC1/StrS family aminotransferase [Sedimentisphaeraceae bacterium JB056]
MQVPMLDLRRQFQQIKDDVMPAIEEVCQSQALCLGPAVDRFETEIAKYCQCRHAIGVSSGTDALLVALMAGGVSAGDEVIVPSFTFAATTGVVARIGAKPVFIDIDKDTFNMDTSQLPSLITDRTKAIIPVHLYGQMADMEPILDIASKHNLLVIEDSAQSIGAKQNDKMSGSLGDFGCYSFYPTKNLGAFGDGGLITTNSDQLNKHTRMVRNHGQNSTYQYEMIGGNFRLDGIQGAVLSVKLKYLNSWAEKRRENAAAYDEAFKGVGDIKTPVIKPYNYSVYNQYTIRTEKRDQLKEHLVGNGVGCGVYYPEPLHLQKCFEYLGYSKGDLPETDKACREVLSIPVSPELTEEQRNYVIEKVKGFYNG